MALPIRAPLLLALVLAGCVSEPRKPSPTSGDLKPQWQVTEPDEPIAETFELAGRHYRCTLPIEVLRTTPRWDPRRSPQPPLPVGQAVAAARALVGPRLFTQGEPWPAMGVGLGQVFKPWRTPTLVNKLPGYGCEFRFRGKDYGWHIPPTALETNPAWSPRSRVHPPLAEGKAMALALKRIKPLFADISSWEVDSIDYRATDIRPMFGEPVSPMEERWIYTLSVSPPLDPDSGPESLSVAVLMDGRVFAPREH